MKIIILADSLAMPRGEGDGSIPLETTYPFLVDQFLRRRFGSQAPLVIERGMRLRTIEDVIAEWPEQVELKKADVVVVHVGVVDCAPRVFLPSEHKFIDNLRFKLLRSFILRFVNKYRRQIIQVRPNRVYVPLARFKSRVEQIVKKAQEANLRSLIFVNIIEPTDSLEKRSPGFKRNVEKYNSILAAKDNGNLIHSIDFNKLIWQQSETNKLMVDGIHINEVGHRILAGKLEFHIMELLNTIV